MSDGTSQSSSSAGSASFDRTAGAQRWGEGGPNGRSRNPWGRYSNWRRM
jgi:hypothetical protein